jgi:hypothetical protein
VINRQQKEAWEAMDEITGNIVAEQLNLLRSARYERLKDERGTVMSSSQIDEDIVCVF